MNYTSQIIKLPKGATHMRVERPLKLPKLKMGLSLAEPVLDADDPETQVLLKHLSPLWGWWQTGDYTS